MPFQRYLLFVTLFCISTFAGFGQGPTWKSLRIGLMSLKYPPTWQTEKHKGEIETLVSLTPDSMRNLGMRIIQISELPIIGDHTYANFKKGFAAALPHSRRAVALCFWF